MKKIIIIIIIFYTSFLFSQENENKTVLKYDEYLEIIKNKLPDLKQYVNIIKLADINLKKSYSIFDLQFDSNFYGLGQQSYTDNENIIVNYSPGFGTESTLSGTLPSGTRLSVGFTYLQYYTSGNNTSQNILTGDEIVQSWDKVNYQPVLNFRITQPLLYNWFGFLDRYGIINAKNKLKIEKIRQDLNTVFIINYYKKLYFQWYGIIKKLDLVKKSIINTEKIFNQTKQKVKVGVLEQDSIEAVFYSLQQYNIKEKQFRYQYNNIVNQLKHFIVLQEYIPDTDFQNTRYLEDINKILNFKNFDETQNALILNLNKNNLKLLKKAKITEVMPYLNLFADVDINFRYVEEIYDGEKNIYSFNDDNNKNIDFKTGLEFSIKLGSISGRNEIKKANVQINDILLEYEKTELNYNSNLNNIIAFNDYIKSSIKINHDSIKSLTNKYNFQLNKFKKGLIDLNDLIDTDNSIITEKINQIDYEVNLINNLIDYEYITK